MEITEAKIKLMPSRTDRLQAFCTITIDNDFVIRDIKIIEGAKGAFVAMPSRKLTDKCPKCGGKNHLRASHCNDCGGPLDVNRATRDRRGRAKLHADIAHPINSACRERIQKKIIEAYGQEVAHSKEPGYVAPKFTEDDGFEETDEFLAAREERSEELADEIEKHRTPHEREEQSEELADEMEKHREPHEREEQSEELADEMEKRREPHEREERGEELADEMEKHRTPHEREEQSEELADEMEKHREPPKDEEKPEKKKDADDFSSGIL